MTECISISFVVCVCVCDFHLLILLLYLAPRCRLCDDDCDAHWRWRVLTIISIITVFVHSIYTPRNIYNRRVCGIMHSIPWRIFCNHAYKANTHTHIHGERNVVRAPSPFHNHKYRIWIVPSSMHSHSHTIVSNLLQSVCDTCIYIYL